MSRSIIANMSNISNQFKAQMGSGTTNRNDYIESISTAVEQSWWDSIVAKLDSFLSHITNGSWSLSEKTVLIHKVDYFKKELINKLKTVELNNPEDIENVASSIDREIFAFVMKNISTKPLTPDVNLCLKSEKGAVPVIQLNSASGLLAEYPGLTKAELLFQNYTPKANNIPQELSQQLCTLMLLCEQSVLWSNTYNDAYLNLTQNINSETARLFAELYAKWDRTCVVEIGMCLCNFQSYIKENGYNIIPPIDYGSARQPKSSFGEKITLWNSIVTWSETANSSVPSTMLSIKDNIYAFLDIA